MGELFYNDSRSMMAACDKLDSLNIEKMTESDFDALGLVSRSMRDNLKDELKKEGIDKDYEYLYKFLDACASGFHKFMKYV